MNNYVYSWNGEDHWSEDIEDIQEEILDNDGCGTYKIYRGLPIKPSVASFVDTDSFIELICDNVYAKFEDCSEDFINRVEQHTKQLQEDLIKAFERHMRVTGASVNFYEIVDIEEIEIEVWE